MGRQGAAACGKRDGRGLCPHDRRASRAAHWQGAFVGIIATSVCVARACDEAAGGRESTTVE